MIYNTYYILLSSDKFRKEEVKSIMIDREFSVFENEKDYRLRKRLQLLEANDFRKAKFTRLDG